MPKIQFYAVNDQRSTAPKKGYSLRPLRLQTIDSRSLAMHVEADSKIDHARVEYIMSSVTKQIREMVLNGHKVELGELGTIGLTCHCTGSDTAAGVKAKDSIKSLQFTFRPSTMLKEKMQQVKYELVVLPEIAGRERDEHGAVVIKNQARKK